jgi:hypothetical protein
MTHRDREEGGDVLVRLGSLSVSSILGLLCITAAHGWMDALHWVMAWVEYLASTMVCMVMWIYLLTVLTMSSCYLLLSHRNTRTTSNRVADMTHRCQTVSFALNLVSHCDSNPIEPIISFCSLLLSPPRDHVWNNLTKLKRCDPSTTSNKAISSPSWPKQTSKKKSLSQKVHLHPYLSQLNLTSSHRHKNGTGTSSQRSQSQ